ncbi:MAG TPA: hypothetical protein VMU83_17020 [Hanamia sp.]|nr:hypothetical protein [Hanamia sp.]
MQECLLHYIPNPLHTNERQIIDEFEVNENLYKRCKAEDLKNPYRADTLSELSHNRSWLIGDILCNPDDVLYNIKPGENDEKYEDLKVCTIRIKDLNKKNRYKKNFSEIKNGEIFNAVIELLHDPIPCMYPHSVFRIWLNGEIITYENYTRTLKRVHQIRNSIREELASMIRKKELSQKDKPE